MKKLIERIKQRDAANERKVTLSRDTLLPNRPIVSIGRQLHGNAADSIEQYDDDNQVINVTKKTKPVPQKVNWKILPPGEYPFDRIEKYIKHLKQTKWKDKKVDIGRIRFLHSLSPIAIYYGLDEFDGYFIFIYKKKNLAVLDCPLFGNAIYIIKGGWRKVSKLSKKEVIEEYPETVRVIHRGNWKGRLKSILETSPKK